MLITYKMLKKAGACQDGLDDFSKQWPSGCHINSLVGRKNLKKAIEIELSLDWFICNLLPRLYSRKYKNKSNLLGAKFIEKYFDLWVPFEIRNKNLYREEKSKLMNEFQKTVDPYREKFNKDLYNLQIKIILEYANKKDLSSK